MRSTVIVIAALAIAGCSEQAVNLGGNYKVAASVPPIENHNIDLLFVVDSSGSMTDEQGHLAATAKAALFDVIDAAVGGQPNLHVGVITPDLDLGMMTGDAACDDGGAGGTLQIGHCAGIDGNYLVDVDAGDGTRTTNYTGTLADAFGCIAQVGGGGCGFEEPFAAVRAALTNWRNTGFLRDDALLVVVFLTDEDDCSGVPALFDPSDTTLPPLDSYRCFHETVQCAQDLDSVGPKTDCVARDDNPLVLPIDSVVEALIDAKGGDPTKVMVAAISGGAEPIEVGTRLPQGGSERLDLIPSCSFTYQDEQLSTADPGIRIATLLDRFPAPTWAETICATPELTLSRTANAIGDLAGRRPCLRGSFKDVDADATGVQPSCRAFLATAAYTPAESRREVDPCDGGDDTGCFRINADSAACSQWTGLAVELVGLQQAPTEQLIVECLSP